LDIFVDFSNRKSVRTSIKIKQQRPSNSIHIQADDHSDKDHNEILYILKSTY